MSHPTICINAKDFNADQLNISEPKEIKTKSNIKMKIADISYLNDKNELCDLYITLPPVSTYGPYPQYNYNSSSKTEKDICGYTISYSNTEVTKLFHSIQKIISNKSKKYIIKPVFVKNKNKNETAYFKVKMNGQTITTNFYSDKKCTQAINALDIVSKFGELTPMIHIRNIYFGAHGTSEYNCSLQINIAKAVFKVKENTAPDFNLDDSESEEE